MNLTLLESRRRRAEHEPVFAQLDSVTGDEYRARAAEYVDLARRDPERRRHLLGMAKSWLRFAARADRIRDLSQRATVIPQNRNYAT